MVVDLAPPDRLCGAAHFAHYVNFRDAMAAAPPIAATLRDATSSLDPFSGYNLAPNPHARRQREHHKSSCSSSASAESISWRPSHMVKRREAVQL